MCWHSFIYLTLYICIDVLIDLHNSNTKSTQLATTPTTMLDYDIAKLAQRLDGWSCSDCMQLVAEAASRPLAVLQSATHFQPVHKGWGADAACVCHILRCSCAG